MRTGAAASAGVATTALAAQGGISSALKAGSGPGAVLRRMFGYLIVLPSLAALVLLTCAVITGRITSMTAVVLLMVGLGFTPRSQASGPNAGWRGGPIRGCTRLCP